MRAKFILGFSALTLSGILCAAAAADLAYPPMPDYAAPSPQYEFGSGWYLRGDVAYAPDDDRALDSGFGHLRRESGLGAGGGVGYRFNTMFRADATGDWLDAVHATRSGTDPAGTTTTARLNVDRYDVLVNGYVDLGNWYGFTPYVGGGVGVGILDPSLRTVVIDAAGERAAHLGTISDRTDLAWAAMAGVSYAVDPNIAIDLGYRHLDLGRLSGSVAGTTVAHDMTRDEVRLGFRYMVY